MLSNHDLLEILRKKILTECGIKEISDENCKLISQVIFERDKNYLSEATIKRFYGLTIKGQCSQFELNSLCYFAERSNFNEFLSHHSISF